MTSGVIDKSPDAFRTISEVAEDLDLPQHVLRFWETRFTHIRPLKRGGGRRYYRPDDIDLLKGIRHFLYGEGYTIKGVQRILKEEGIRFVQAVGRGEASVAAPRPDGTPGVVALAHSGDDPNEHRPIRVGNAAATQACALPHRALQELQGALQELFECDRVLSSLLMQGEPAQSE
jgi:DNA-binding transcriptional MerR regulator